MPREVEEAPDNPVLDLRQRFNSASNLSFIIATYIRPFLLARQGIRAYGIETVQAFFLLPVIGMVMRSGDIFVFWHFWTVAILVRKCFPNRRTHTRFWGEPRLINFLTFGRGRFFAPLLAMGVAYLYWPNPLAKLIGFSGACLGFQYRIATELLKREREVIHNAILAARWYR